LPGMAFAWRHDIPIIAAAHTRIVDGMDYTTSDHPLARLAMASPTAKSLLYWMEFAGLAAHDLTLVNGLGFKKYIDQRSPLPVNIKVRAPGIKCSAADGRRSWNTDTQAQTHPHTRTHITMLYLGRLAGEKRIDILCSAFKQVVERDPTVHLVVAGPDQGELWRVFDLIERFTANVRYVGTVAEESVPSLLEDADALLFPGSHVDTYVRVVFEAACAGLPVLASNGAVWTENYDLLPHVIFSSGGSFGDLMLEFVEGSRGKIDLRVLGRFLDELPSETESVNNFFVETSVKIQQANGLGAA